MDKVQSDALKYFWDFAEPNSYLGRERYHEDDIYPDNDKHVITTGGSGFGLMTILVGVDRKYIPRQEAVKRLTQIADFLEKADRFHGAWPHWINGETGKVVPFGKKDNGGDLVETAFLTQGIICVREYFKNGNEEEKALAAKNGQTLERDRVELVHKRRRKSTLLALVTDLRLGNEFPTTRL